MRDIIASLLWMSQSASHQLGLVVYPTFHGEMKLSPGATRISIRTVPLSAPPRLAADTAKFLLADLPPGAPGVPRVGHAKGP